MFPECYFLSPHVNPELGHAGYKEEQSSAKLCPIQEKQCVGGLLGGGRATAAQLGVGS